MRFEIDDLILRLRDDVLCRRIDSDANWLQILEDLLASNNVEHSSAVFVGYLSQWVDIVSGSPEAVKKWLDRLNQTQVSSLRLGDYLHVRLAAGTVAFAEKKIEQATQHFDFIIGLADEMMATKELLAFGYFWKARCEEASGAFNSAFAHVRQGCDIMMELGYPRMAAAMEVGASRLCLEQDRLAEGTALLETAEAVITEADDPLTVAEIGSVYGRIALRQGRYEQALKHFSISTELFRKIHRQHSNLARCLVNTARSKRLLALRLARRIDAEVGARRKTPSREPAMVRNPSADLRRLFEQLQAEAFSALSEAEEIFRSNREHAGLGLVRVVRSVLFFDDGDLESAELEAAEAYDAGSETNNLCLMANARLVQSWIESGKYEEGLVGNEDPLVHVQRSYDYGKEALELAERGAHRRLIARAHISQGLLLCNDFFDNIDAARECCDRAAEYFTADHRDYVWEQYQVLRAWVQRRSLVSQLRNSSQGSLAGKSLQQMTAEFEEAIIPRVWELEDRKISRAAARLSISPKKVRRVLNRLRLDGAHRNRSERMPGPLMHGQRRVGALR
jgi:tetratricopeptide (TPR) repeat protein